jgi:hypothetical protein
MASARSSWVVFALAGLVSGLISGLSVILRPIGVVAPGLLFGAALGHAIHMRITSLSYGQRAMLMAGSTCGYFAAIVAALAATRLPGFNNGLLYGACAGAIGGGIGAMIVATSLLFIAPLLSPPRTLLNMTLAGACFGAIFMLCGVYISDHTALGHPFDDIVAFPVWQTGVASVVPFCKRCSTADSAA